MISHITPKAVVSVLEPSFVRITVKDGEHIEPEDVYTIHRAKMELLNGQKHVVLLISGRDTSISKEAREISASPEIQENRKAKAIVINSLAQLLIGNFFIRVNRPVTPVRLFRCENEASQWLRSFIE